MENSLTELKNIQVNDGGVLEAFISLYEICVTNPRTFDEYGNRLDQIRKNLKFDNSEDELIVDNALEKWHSVANIEL
jgi:hypothetical protein